MDIKDIKSVSTPTCMISQYWPTSREIEGETLAAIQWVLQDGFFEAFQTVEVPYPDERASIAAIMNERDLYLDYCIARVLNENNANLSALDDDIRTRSVQLVKDQLQDAREIGASSISFVGGLRPEDMGMRSRALEALQRSMVEVCAYASENFPGIKIMLEALDVNADKKHAFGYKEDALALVEYVASKGQKLYINVDTAHVWLNNEDPIAFLESIRPYVHEFHFCNCVVDTSHELFGDKHIEFGEPGLMTYEMMHELLNKLVANNFLNQTDKPYLLFEVIKPGHIASEEHMRNCKAFFIEAAKKNN